MNFIIEFSVVDHRYKACSQWTKTRPKDGGIQNVGRGCLREQLHVAEWDGCAAMMAQDRDPMTP